VIFLPRGDAQKLYPGYAQVAQSLGLACFSAWDTQSIEIRSIEQNYPLMARFEAERLSTPRDFRDRLEHLLDRLKPLSVTGAIPPADLSSCYLVNLCLLTLDHARASILDSVRRHRDDEVLASTELRTENLAWHSLFHLLSLTAHDLLPESVHAERLERGMEIASASLPPYLQESCRRFDPAPLPEEAAVAFHHLFRRLVQLGWHGDRERMRDTVLQLLQISAKNLHTSDAADIPAASPEKTLTINPAWTGADHLDALVASPSRLPGLVLHRELTGAPPVPHVGISLFALPTGPEVRYQRVAGCLLPHSLEETLSADEILVRLRISWPNRRFRPPRHTPHWVLALIHLLGLCDDGARLELTTPADWPRTPAGRFLVEVLKECATIERIEQLPDKGLRLDLKKVLDPLAPCSLALPGGERILQGGWLHAKPATSVALGIYLPDAAWGLLRQEELTFFAPEHLPQRLLSGIRHFVDSSWGQLLASASGLDMMKTHGQAPPPEIAQYPLPSLALLEQLSSPDLAKRPAEQARLQVERELSQWLSVTPPQNENPAPGNSRPHRLSAEEKQRLVAAVFADGIPIFPDHYLFDHYRPAMETFTIPGPLYFQRRFFNQVELATREGQLLIAENDHLAHALLLVSHLGRTQVSLPRDTELLAKILARYLDTLRTLKGRLWDESNRLCDEAGQARALAKRTWLQQGLPPWETIEIEF